MQEHSLHQEGSDLGGSPEGRKDYASGQAEMGTPVRPQQVETDYRDQTIQSFAQSILRLGQECRTLADENKTLKAKVERLTSNLLGRDATIMGLDSIIKCRDAEVERLKEAWVDKKMQEDRDYLLKENERLKELSENLMAQLNFDMDAWLPIETAQKDGTDVLCFCVEPEFAEEENPHKEFRVCFYGQLMPDYSCWMSHYGYEQHPTHWMSLPKPPKP